MKKLNMKYFILILLVLIFAAPGIAAYFFYQHPAWLSASKVNKGTLLSSPIALTAFEKGSKWNLVLVLSGDCDSVCMRQLDTLARVRLALGRKLYQVNAWLLFENQEAVVSESLVNFLQDKDIQWASLSRQDKEALNKQAAQKQLFIVNPNNDVILGYSGNGNPDDVYKDLKLLLKSN